MNSTELKRPKISSLTKSTETSTEFNQEKMMAMDEDENPPYSPKEALEYYEEILKETLNCLEKVQWENSRSINSLPDSKDINVFEREMCSDIEVCYHEIAAIIDTARTSIHRRISTSIIKRKEYEKFNDFCKTYWGGENNGKK